MEGLLESTNDYMLKIVRFVVGLAEKTFAHMAKFGVEPGDFTEFPFDQVAKIEKVTFFTNMKVTNCDIPPYNTSTNMGVHEIFMNAKNDPLLIEGSANDILKNLKY
ncbi:hypothetical protein AYI68_g2127 [Smittium mucronatum]|uniref:Uncharacterized protein n=1 Tax=Smittium mucronatum TaxID=133383 RepID=A0A1R0H3L1_9FUNG|nr:hypothetical protein AYI68_g2127 [Smittium mucronatum]